MTRPSPILILLPGMDGTGRMFAPLMVELQDEYECRVIAYPTQEFLGYDALLPYVRDRLPTREPFVIVAESFSGPLAVELAADPPTGLSGVVLACSFTRNPRPNIGWLRHGLKHGPALRPAPWMAAWFLLGDSRTPELCSLLREANLRVHPAVMLKRLLAIAAVDVSRHLPKARVPLLYLRASDDRLVPAHNANAMPEAMEIAGPHLLLQANPKASARAIRTFLSRLSKPSA